MRAAGGIDVVSPEFKANPFPIVARLRAEEPVVRTFLPDKMPATLVLRYADVVPLLTDPRFAKRRASAMTPEQLRRQPWVPPMFRALDRNMLDLDPPDHTRLRSLVHQAFTPRLVERMRKRAQELADGFIEAVRFKGSMDLVADFALPLPMALITEILGIPAEDREKFHAWSSHIVSADSLNPSWRFLPAVWKFRSYLKRFFERRRAEPGDDLTTALLRAEEQGDRLSGDELFAMVFLLLVAGHETTVNLIADGTLALLQNPEQMSKLRDDPALTKSAVEELLRFTSPVFLATERFAREDVTIHGATIPRGEVAFGVLGSANRDEAVFDDPDRLDLTRPNNRHLSFGQGIHYCLGAPLARLEAQIAFDSLLGRLPGLRLAVPAESLRWRRSLVLRGLEALPVAF